MATRELNELQVRRYPWRDFRPWFRRNFTRGQHVFVVGKTGSGKSYLLREIISGKPDWDWVILDAKGGMDPSLQIPGFRTGHEWPPTEEQIVPAMLSFPDQMRRWFSELVRGPLEPELAEREPKRVHFAPPKVDDAQLHAIFDRVLKDLSLRGEHDGFGGIVFDEGNTIAGAKNDGGLGLYNRLSPMFRTKRFERTSLVIGTQYPSWIPKSAYNETTHRFFFRVADEDRRKRIAEIAGNKEVAALIPRLRKHEFLYHHEDRDLYFISKVE